VKLRAKTLDMVLLQLDDDASLFPNMKTLTVLLKSYSV